MPAAIAIRAGDTEPLEIIVSAVGATTLDDLASAVLYARLTGAAVNHVDGVECTVTDSAARELTFDPVGAKNGGGNAFDAPGVYRCYLLLTWDDADETRHPGEGWLIVNVSENYE